MLQRGFFSFTDAVVYSRHELSRGYTLNTLPLALGYHWTKLVNHPLMGPSAFPSFAASSLSSSAFGSSSFSLCFTPHSCLIKTGQRSRKWAAFSHLNTIHIIPKIKLNQHTEIGYDKQRMKYRLGI